MAGVETYGGCCPNCLKGMLQKWESSWSFMFDACPWCKFIFFEGAEGKTKEEIWEEILEHHGVGTQKELIESSNLEEYVNKENSEFYPSIYNYRKDEGTHMMYKLVWESVEKDKELKGTRVFLKNNENTLGTLMEYRDGIVKVLWDNLKERNLLYTEYNGIDVGSKIKIL